MMPPSTFVEECRRRGVALELVGAPPAQRIRASGVAPVDPARFAAYLKAQKPALVEILTGNVFAVAHNPALAPETAPRADIAPEAPTRPVDAPMARLGTDVSPEPAATATETAIEEDELREQAQVSAVLLSAWRALWAGRLAVGAFELGPGRWVTDPARWLQWAAGRRAYLLREHGPTWWDTDAGQILARDLYTFADWYEVAGLAEPGEGAPAPPWPKPSPMVWAPRWGTRPDPAAVALDSAAPWPDGPADTPERERQWSERVALFMAAQGRHPADVAELVAAYGIDSAPVAVGS